MRNVDSYVHGIHVKLAALGESPSAEIADPCGVARSYLFTRIKAVRGGGIDATLQRFRADTAAVLSLVGRE